MLLIIVSYVAVTLGGDPLRLCAHFVTMEFFPFQLLRAPVLKLKAPNVEQPSAMTVFSVLFLSYFFVLSGIIYDIIVEPPSIGSTQDEVTGSVKPVAFLAYRVNGQYIIEGLSAGLLFVLGALGFIILDRANKKHMSNKSRYLLLGAGMLLIIVSYNLAITFLKIKVPGYMISSG
eukprot:TRINITY_DN2206_c0_g1_i1.p1 TRINITY_DN2206_c0_g1~~TRINITY_DN2206_c0_g1_i1.p1  ORF type:complete len:175 (-),score=4.08 TRINITY_DN2206_c0_g1_i1:208-732(-)